MKYYCIKKYKINSYKKHICRINRTPYKIIGNYNDEFIRLIKYSKDKKKSFQFSINKNKFKEYFISEIEYKFNILTNL